MYAPNGRQRLHVCRDEKLKTRRLIKECPIGIVTEKWTFRPRPNDDVFMDNI